MMFFFLCLPETCFQRALKNFSIFKFLQIHFVKSYVFIFHKTGLIHCLGFRRFKTEKDTVIS